MHESVPTGGNSGKVHVGGSAYKFGSGAEAFGKIGNAIAGGVGAGIKAKKASNKRMLDTEIGMHKLSHAAAIDHVSTALDREHHADVLTQKILPAYEPGTQHESIDKMGYVNRGTTRGREDSAAKPAEVKPAATDDGGFDNHPNVFALGSGAVHNTSNEQFKGFRPVANEVTSNRVAPMALEGDKSTPFESRSPSARPGTAAGPVANRFSTDTAGETTREGGRVKRSKPQPSLGSVKDASGNIPMTTKGKTLKGKKLKNSYTGFHMPNESTND